MKNIIYFFLSVCSFVLMSAGCRKHKNNLETELAKLPPATQVGANTFGCLVNGKAWTPKGWDGRQPNFFVIVDPSYRNGDFSLRTYKLNNDTYENYTINSDSIRSTGTYIISDVANTRVIFTKGNADLSQITCKIYYNGNYNRKGFLKISRYDLQSGIVSGEFECTLYDRAITCDTIKITHGRFDYKL